MLRLLKGKTKFFLSRRNKLLKVNKRADNTLNGYVLFSAINFFNRSFFLNLFI